MHLRSAGFIVAGAATLWLYINGRIKKPIAYVIFACIDDFRFGSGYQPLPQ